MIDISEVAANADIIVSGYAFTADGQNIRVLNLDRPASAAVIDGKSEVIETTMNDVELDIVMDIYSRNKRYMED